MFLRKDTIHPFNTLTAYQKYGNAFIESDSYFYLCIET